MRSFPSSCCESHGMLDKAVVPGADCDSVEEDRNDADMALKFADRSADFNDSALNPIGLGLRD